MISLLLLDASPDLPPADGGIGGVIVLAIIVLALVSALILGFVFLLVWRQRNKRELLAAGSAPQPSSPNQ